MIRLDSCRTSRYSPRRGHVGFPRVKLTRPPPLLSWVGWRGDGVQKWRWLLLVIPVLVLGGGLWLWLAVGVHWFEPNPGQGGDAEKSSDVATDLLLMWETRKLGGTPDPTHGLNPRSSTDRAINAASRVFNTVELVGKTREEVVRLLGDPKASSDSIYNFPFWPAPKDALVYRFDSGAYGWQFNVVLGDDGKVREVKRHWIH
jgi:hypothetical protein